MPFVTLAEARMHLRHDSGTTEDTLISMWLQAAEDQCVEFLGCNVYVDGDALTTAQAGAAAILETAQATYETAIESHAAIEDDAERAAKAEAAEAAYKAAQHEYLATMNGIVVNDSIKAAILLQTAHLFEHRILDAEMPAAHRNLLWQYRAGLGV